jgi:hypothetical protein
MALTYTVSRRGVVTVLTVALWCLWRYDSRLWTAFLGDTGGDALHVQQRVDITPSSSNDSVVISQSVTYVIASVKRDNLSWTEHLKVHPGDEIVVYVADDLGAKYHPPVNKGRESMQYLSYFIENYATLPEVMIFIHAGQMSWHNPFLLQHDLQQMMKVLRRNYIVEKGFVNLQCDWGHGCPDFLQMNVSAVKGRSLYHQTRNAQDAFAELFPGQSMPNSLAVPGGGQFAVTRDLVHRIPLERFLFFRSWLMESSLDSYQAGQIFEFFWHMMFLGISASQLCPTEPVCYCQQYGVCLGSSDGTSDAAENELHRLKYLGPRRDKQQLSLDYLKAWWEDRAGASSYGERRHVRSRMSLLEEELHLLKQTWDDILTRAIEHNT